MRINEGKVRRPDRMETTVKEKHGTQSITSTRHNINITICRYVTIIKDMSELGTVNNAADTYGTPVIYSVKHRRKE